MNLGRVIGRLVATQRVEAMRNYRLLIVQPLDHDGKPTGGPTVACDAVQAGPGDTVFLVGSREAALALEPWFVPVDAAIVGIVDQVHVDELALREAGWEDVP